MLSKFAEQTIPLEIRQLDAQLLPYAFGHKSAAEVVLPLEVLTTFLWQAQRDQVFGREQIVNVAQVGVPAAGYIHRKHFFLEK